VPQTDTEEIRPLSARNVNVLLPHLLTPVGPTQEVREVREISLMGVCIIQSFIHFIFHISLYSKSTKDVEIVKVVVYISVKKTDVKCLNIIII